MPEGVGLGGRQGGGISKHSVVKSGERGTISSEGRVDGGIARALVRRDVRLVEGAASLLRLPSQRGEFFQKAIRIT